MTSPETPRDAAGEAITLYPEGDLVEGIVQAAVERDQLKIAASSAAEAMEDAIGELRTRREALAEERAHADYLADVVERMSRGHVDAMAAEALAKHRQRRTTRHEEESG
jgi:hypothetical protein